MAKQAGAAVHVKRSDVSRRKRSLAEVSFDLLEGKALEKDGSATPSPVSSARRAVSIIHCGKD